MSLVAGVTNFIDTAIQHLPLAGSSPDLPQVIQAQNVKVIQHLPPGGSFPDLPQVIQAHDVKVIQQVNQTHNVKVIQQKLDYTNS